MDLELEGKIALITGSSHGLGFAIAKALKNEGCHVILNGRDRRQLEDAATSLGKQCEIIVADVTTDEGSKEVATAIETNHGKLDVLVCNVGSGRSVPPLQESLEEWQRMIDINLYSALHVIYATRPLLASAKGAILCVSSICGMEALGCPLAYSAAKAALNSFVAGSSRPLAKDGIRINAIAPGNILFPGSVWEKKLKEDSNAVKEMLSRDVALNRLGESDEVGDLAAFVVSPRCAFSTGSIFVLDGGQLRS